MSNELVVSPRARLSDLTASQPARRYAEPPGQPSPAMLIQALRAALRWWKIALPTGLVLAAGGIAAVLANFEKQYRSAALLQIQDQPTHLAYPTHEDPTRYVQNQLQLIRSPLVLGPAISDPAAAAITELQEQKDPIGWLSRRIRVVNVGDSELFEVSFDSSQPERGAPLVNAVVASYLTLRGEHDSTRNQRMLEVLDEEKELRSQEVTRLRENVRELSREILGKDPFTGQQTAEVVLTSHPLQALLTQLINAQVESKMLDVQLRSHRQSNEKRDLTIPAAIVAATVDRHPEVSTLKQQHADLIATLDRIEEVSVHGKKDPSYARTQREANKMDESLARTRKSLTPQILAELEAEAAMQRDTELAKMEQALAKAQAAEELLKAEYEAQAKTLGETGSQSLELEFAKAELAREERVFELIAQRAVALRTETRAPARVTLMKPATPPLVPLETFPLKKVAMALLLGLCAPFGIAVLWERWVRRIANAEQLDQQTRVRVVGEVARLPARRYATTELTHRDLSLFEESVDSLRTCIVLGHGNADVHVIAVASAVSGEGKTSVAAQLAVSIARATGEATLLIDADIRSPDVHEIFQISNDVGLANILEANSALEDCVNRDWSELVHVLPAGRASANPHTLINSQRFRNLLQEVRGKYNHVIIDTPPILLASESLAIAKEADGTLLCTMRDFSRESQVNSATSRLEAVGARILGAVLSGIPTGHYTAKYGNYAHAE